MRWVDRLKGMTALSATVIVGLGIAGCGTSTNTSAAGFKTGSYSGTTSQGQTISFTVTSTSVEDVLFGWQATCADGQSHSNTMGGWNTPITSAGAFTLDGSVDTGASGQVAGTVKGNTASGTLSRSGPSSFGTDCSDNGVAWTATAP